MNRILKRQLKRFMGEFAAESVPVEWQALIDSVSETYDHADEDRNMLMRSMDLSSKEFNELNKKLKLENDVIEMRVKERTKELEYERTKLDEIAKHMATGAILLDANSDVKFANEAAKKMLGLLDAQVIVHTLDDLFPSFAIMEHIAQSLAGNSTEITEVEMGDVIFSISFVPLKSENSITGTLIWMDNITSQKLLERGKDQFLAIASHEMRTPLAIIRGSAELLLGNEQVRNNIELKEDVKSIEKSSIRLLGIVNDFLDVQNIDQGNILLKTQSVDVMKILDETFRDLSLLANEKKLFLKLVSPPYTIPPIQVDPYRLQQIIINLVSNAIHNTNSGGVKVIVVKDETSVRILVEDSGIGISVKDQSRLFKKFETSNAFLHSSEYGSGLGLYISNILARVMDGELTLEKSELNVGSTFSLSFPLISKNPINSTQV